MINEQTRVGREIAKNKGVKFEREPKLTLKQINRFKQDKIDGMSVIAITTDFYISRKTVYGVLEKAS